MLAVIFVFVGVVATLTAGATFVQFDTATRALLALFSAFAWSIWGFGAYDVETVQAGVSFSFTYESLAFLGFGAAVVMALFFIQRFLQVAQEQMGGGV